MKTGLRYSDVTLNIEAEQSEPKTAKRRKAKEVRERELCEFPETAISAPLWRN